MDMTVNYVTISINQAPSGSGMALDEIMAVYNSYEYSQQRCYLNLLTSAKVISDASLPQDNTIFTFLGFFVFVSFFACLVFETLLFISV